MIRPVLFLFAALLFPLILRGQITITVDPTVFVLTGNPNQHEVISHTMITNTSNETLNLYWTRRVSNEPGPWRNFICDQFNCYDSLINANPLNRPNILAPGEHFDLQVHLEPHQTVGTGDILLNILDASGNILGSTNGTMVISESTAVKDANDLKLTVFPNPTSDYFQVSETPGLKGIEVFNIVGNKIRSFDFAVNRQYYVGDLSDGIYLVRLVSGSKKVLKTIRLSKR